MKAKFIVTIILILFLLCAGFCQEKDLQDSSKEIYRIRVENVAGGLVQVSCDKGKTWLAVGMVKTPAKGTAAGFMASEYTPGGCVAATAVHGIRIKIGPKNAFDNSGKALEMISIVPTEFEATPVRYNGHVPGSSGIITDINAGHSIFRNESPYVGNPVYIKKGLDTERVIEGYKLKQDDVLVIIVLRPEIIPKSIEFENKEDGNVTVNYPDGSSKVIARVAKAVTGVGRYDGTTFNGPGSINTNHGGVLTIATSPKCPPGTVEGDSIETRGGFMIQPYYHTIKQDENKNQVMIIGPKENKYSLEGTPPLYFGNINLAFFPDTPEKSYRVQLKIDNGDWEDCPPLVGRIDDAFTPESLTKYFSQNGKTRTVLQGLTAVKLNIPEFDEKAVLDDLIKEADLASQKAKKNGIKSQKGLITLEYKNTDKKDAFVSYYIDGSFAGATNSYPFTIQWDSKNIPNGLHIVTTKYSTDSSEATIQRYNILIEN